MKKSYLAPLAVLAGLSSTALPAMACEVEVGMVMELTGPAGVYGQAGAKAVEMAFKDINEAGGVLGCELTADTRDSQSQGNVAVDQATQLVNIKHVPVVIGGIISSVSLPILTSVTAPAKVVQVSPASSSPTLTQLGKEGKTPPPPPPPEAISSAPLPLMLCREPPLPNMPSIRGSRSWPSFTSTMTSAST